MTKQEKLYKEIENKLKYPYPSAQMIAEGGCEGKCETCEGKYVCWNNYFAEQENSHPFYSEYVNIYQGSREMREIKFRGKTFEGTKVQSRWISGLPWSRVGGGITPDSINAIRDDEYGNIYTVFAETVGQYTGLKDKNGVEIYEGDIVKTKYHELRNFGDEITDDYSEFVEEVTWLPSHNGFVLKIMVEDIPLYRPLDFVTKVNGIKLIELEVIGNIYDNPELLEVDE